MLEGDSVRVLSTATDTRAALNFFDRCARPSAVRKAALASALRHDRCLSTFQTNPNDALARSVGNVVLHWNMRLADKVVVRNEYSR